jgi:hypothetical protein
MRPDAIDVTSVRLPGTILPIAVRTGDASLPPRGLAAFVVGARSVSVAATGRVAAQPDKRAVTAKRTMSLQDLCTFMDGPPMG